LFFIQNLLRYYAEKILRVNTTNLRGDYRGALLGILRSRGGVVRVLHVCHGPSSSASKATCTKGGNRRSW